VYSGMTIPIFSDMSYTYISAGSHTQLNQIFGKLLCTCLTHSLSKPLSLRKKAFMVSQLE